MCFDGDLLVFNHCKDIINFGVKKTQSPSLQIGEPDVTSNGLTSSGSLHYHFYLHISFFLTYGSVPQWRG